MTASALTLPSGTAGHVPPGSEWAVLFAAINQAYGSRVRKTADQTVNNSSTLVNDTELTWSVAANSNYRVNVEGIYNSNSTANFKIGWSLPGGASIIWNALYVAVGGALTVSGNLGVGVLSLGGTGGDSYFRFTGTITTIGTAGTVVSQWAQNTANASNTIVRAGSYAELFQL